MDDIFLPVLWSVPAVAASLTGACPLSFDLGPHPVLFLPCFRQHWSQAFQGGQWGSRLGSLSSASWYPFAPSTDDLLLLILLPFRSLLVHPAVFHRLAVPGPVCSSSLCLVGEVPPALPGVCCFFGHRRFFHSCFVQFGPGFAPLPLLLLGLLLRCCFLPGSPDLLLQQSSSLSHQLTQGRRIWPWLRRSPIPGLRRNHVRFTRWWWRWGFGRSQSSGGNGWRRRRCPRIRRWYWISPGWPPPSLAQG